MGYLTLSEAQAIPAIPAPDARPIASVVFERPSHEGDVDHWAVRVRWTDVEVDRVEGMGWTVSLSKPDLADRLRRAIDAGVVFSGMEIRTDVGRKTYVSAGFNVMGRRLNADLLRLGY